MSLALGLGLSKSGVESLGEIITSTLNLTMSELIRSQELNLKIDEGMFTAALSEKIDGYSLAVKVDGIDNNGNPVEDRTSDGKQIMLNPLLKAQWKNEYNNNPAVSNPETRFDNELKNLREKYIQDNYESWLK